ncbi:MAG: PQQ-binding-like beta-propeller repeat protein, partial [Alphaproteobacteria bacterium]
MAESKPRLARRVVLPPIVVGGLVLAIGIVLAVGGAWLAALGGSLYYLPAGLGLAVAGVLLIRRREAGAWVYLIVFVLTLAWALWEVGLRGWPLVPRTVPPAVLLVLVIAIWPLLEPRRMGWTAAVGAIVAVALVGTAAGFAMGVRNTFEVRHAVPGMRNEAMADPSPMAVGADWPAYGGTYSARRYSPLAEITPANVAGLERAWTYHTRDLPQSEFARDKYGAETTPLKVGDSLYLCSAKNILIALDAASGTERWRFDPKVPDEAIPSTAACRGVAYFAAPDATGQACAARIIEGTLDARLIAVDAATGKPCAEFGDGGQVDITVGMGRTVPGMVSMTSAPTIVRGVVVTGHQVLDGQKRDAPSGVIQGFDAVTGELRWAWDMEHPERSGRPPPGETYARGT